jgi:ABC-2 type transport system ATP-binding protein
MIEVDHVTKRFDRATVLDDLSLKVGRGDRIALVGANGAGKTTLVRCLLGEYRYEGDIRVGGLEPRTARRDVLRRVGFVPQLPPPLRMTARHLIDFTASLAGIAPRRIDETAVHLGLDPASLSRRPFVKLSGGQKQKLLIACALGRPCDLLFLDEPAANLDPEARQAFFELLQARVGDSTMLISSHRLDEVAPLVDRVVELDLGRVVLDDRVADDAALTDRFDCSVELVRADPACQRALEGWSLEADASGQRFVGRIAAPERLRFLGTISRSGIIVRLEITGGSE